MIQIYNCWCHFIWNGKCMISLYFHKMVHTYPQLVLQPNRITRSFLNYQRWFTTISNITLLCESIKKLCDNTFLHDTYIWISSNLILGIRIKNQRHRYYYHPEIKLEKMMLLLIHRPCKHLVKYTSICIIHVI